MENIAWSQLGDCEWGGELCCQGNHGLHANSQEEIIVMQEAGQIPR